MQSNVTDLEAWEAAGRDLSRRLEPKLLSP